MSLAKRDQARLLATSLVEAYNKKDPEAIAALCTGDVQLWSALGGERHGRESVIAYIRGLLSRLPDEQLFADTVVTDGETVVVELTSRGSDPHGRRYEIAFTEVLELRGGQIAEIRTYIDPDEVSAAIG